MYSNNNRNAAAFVKVFCAQLFLQTFL